MQTNRDVRKQLEAQLVMGSACYYTRQAQARVVTWLESSARLYRLAFNRGLFGKQTELKHLDYLNELRSSSIIWALLELKSSSNASKLGSAWLVR